MDKTAVITSTEEIYQVYMIVMGRQQQNEIYANDLTTNSKGVANSILLCIKFDFCFASNLAYIMHHIWLARCTIIAIPWVAQRYTSLQMYMFV